MSSGTPNDKIISLTEALSLIGSGQRVALGGVQMARRPFGAVRQLLSSEVRELEIVTHSVCMDADVLMADRRVSTLRHVVPRKTTLGPPPAFAAAQEDRSITLIPETNATLTAGLRASLAGMAFFPMRHVDLGDVGRARDDLIVIDCPFTKAPVIAIPPLSVDVAILHVHAADPSGAVRIDSAAGMDQEMALAAKTTIVTAERIVPDVGRGGLVISGRHIDAVVELPYGAFPAACLPHYKWDLGYALSYYDAVREGQFAAFRETLVVPSYDQFLSQSRAKREARSRT